MKQYLGDGVYVAVENGMLKLTTEVGLPEPTNVIFLEPEVFVNLKRYYEAAVEKAGMERTA